MEYGPMRCLFRNSSSLVTYPHNKETFYLGHSATTYLLPLFRLSRIARLVKNSGEKKEMKKSPGIMRHISGVNYYYVNH